jgi:hypothetical protein
MIRFYTNRQLSQTLNVNLSKWKRWSREFLAPDPLGGLQSGYARQFNRDDAFTVYIGGYLVGDMGFTIPEARRILSDLAEPFTELGYFESHESRFPVSNFSTEIRKRVRYYYIVIAMKGTSGSKHLAFTYYIRGVLSEHTVEPETDTVRQVRYAEYVVGDSKNGTTFTATSPKKILPISALFDQFLKALDGVPNGQR